MANSSSLPVNDPIIKRIEEVLKAQKRTKKDLLHSLGLQDSNFTNWKYKNSKSYMKYIDKISVFLGVSTNYLIYGEDIETNTMKLEDDELELITRYRLLEPKKKHFIFDCIAMIQ